MPGKEFNMLSFFKRKSEKKAPMPDDSSEKPGQQEKIPSSPESQTQSDTPAESADQRQVKIYSLSTCSHCKAAKKFLSDCTIKYEFIDVDQLQGEERKAILEDVKKFNPKCTFPTIVIGDKVIIGNKEEEIKEALGL